MLKTPRAFYPTHPLGPTNPTSPTKTDVASSPGELLHHSALSLVKAANEALNLSKVWSLSCVLGPTPLHQQNQLFVQLGPVDARPEIRPLTISDLLDNL